MEQTAYAIDDGNLSNDFDTTMPSNGNNLSSMPALLPNDVHAILAGFRGAYSGNINVAIHFH